jgi:hypothetical protein
MNVLHPYSFEPNQNVPSRLKAMASALLLSVIAIYLCCILAIIYSGGMICDTENHSVSAATALSLLIAMIGILVVFYFIGRVGSSIMDDVVHVETQY